MSSCKTLDQIACSACSSEASPRHCSLLERLIAFCPSAPQNVRQVLWHNIRTRVPAGSGCLHCCRCPSS